MKSGIRIMESALFFIYSALDFIVRIEAEVEFWLKNHK